MPSMPIFPNLHTLPSIMPSAVASLRRISPTKLLKPVKLASSQILAGLHPKRKAASIHPFSVKPSNNNHSLDRVPGSDDDIDDEDAALDDEQSPLQSMESPFCRLIQETHHHELRQVVLQFLHEHYLDQLSTDSSGAITDLDMKLDALYFLFRQVLSLESVSRDTLDVVRQEFDSFVFPRLVPTDFDDLVALSPKLIAKILSFVNFYLTHWSETLFPEDRTVALEQLKSEYLRRGVHDQVRSMMENRIVLFDDDDIVETEAGILCTRICEDVDLIISSQLKVAAESLPPSMTRDVLRACNEELDNLAGGLMFHIEATWKNMSVERLCCCINDAQLLLDQFEARNESILESPDEASEHLLAEFSIVALHSTRFLCERILMDLKDDHLMTIGSIVWEQNGSIVDTVVVTLKDFFGDIIHWVPAEYFFPKILKICFDLILSKYVESFFSNTMTHGIQSRDRAVITLRSDYEKMLQFFSVEQDEHLGRAGYYDKPTLRNNLHILKVIANILQANPTVDGLHDDFVIFLKEWGPDTGAAAIFHIFGLQGRRISKSEAQLWHETIALAQEHLLMQGGNGNNEGTVRYPIPDLRNSLYITKMRKAGRLRNKNGLDLTKTNKLIQQNPPTSKLVASSRRMFRGDRNLMTTWRLAEELETGNGKGLPVRKSWYFPR